MRSLGGLALSFLILSSAHAQAFPLPLTPDRAVSDVVRGAAAGGQANPFVATNGDMALVVWADYRDQFNAAVYAARVDAAGNVLDPLGVRIRSGVSINTVAWNGEAFVIVMGSTFAFVAPDMTVSLKTVDVAAYVYV